MNTRKTCKKLLRNNTQKFIQQCKNYIPNLKDKILFKTFRRNKLPNILSKTKKFAEEQEQKAMIKTKTMENAQKRLVQAKRLYSEAQMIMDTLEGYRNNFRSIDLTREDKNRAVNLIEILQAPRTKNSLKKAKNALEIARQKADEVILILPETNAESEGIINQAINIQDGVELLLRKKDEIVQDLNALTQEAEDTVSTRFIPAAFTPAQEYNEALRNLGSRELTKNNIDILISPPPSRSLRGERVAALKKKYAGPSKPNLAKVYRYGYRGGRDTRKKRNY